MTKPAPSLRAFGDLQQYFANNESTAPAAPAPATDAAPVVGTVRVTYNLSASKLVRAFIETAVLSHDVTTPMANVGTLGSFELSFTNADTLQDVVRVLADSGIPTVKYYTTMTPPTLVQTAPAADTTDTTDDVVARAAADEAAAESDTTPYDRAIADHDAAAPVDTYQGRRVLEALPLAAAPTLHPDRPTDIFHVATGSVFATYPTLAEAEMAYALSTSPRKHEFDLRQQILPDDFETAPQPDVADDTVSTVDMSPVLEIDGDDAPVATADDIAAGPYTLMMRSGDRWETLSEFVSEAAARFWIWNNVRSEQFDPTEWVLYNAADDEIDLDNVFAASAPAPLDAPEPVLDVTPVVPADVVPLTDRTNRAAVIEHIASFYSLIGLPVRDDLKQLSDTALSDLLRLLETNNGGSLEAAAVIRAVEESYARFVRSPTLALKTAAVDAMGKAYFSQVQRVQEALGTDTTIAGMKGTAYHDQVKALVQHVSVLNDSIMDVGELLQIRVPIDGLSSAGGDVAIKEGLPFNPKICMYVLEVFRGNIQNLHNRTVAQAEDLKRALARAADAEATTKRVREEANNAIAAYRVREEHMTALMAVNSDTYWVLRTTISKKYLAKIDPTAPIKSAHDMELQADESRALRIPSRARAMEVMDRLAATTRFRKIEFKLYRVTQMAEG